MSSKDSLPVVVIGAGPVGLAAAAHLVDRGLPVVVLEAGEQVGAAMRAWGHIRTFTPWQFIVDAAAEKLLAPTGWARPAERRSPTGEDIVERYLTPLAAVLGSDVVRTGSRVVAVTRRGLDRSRSVGRAERPFVVRVQRAEGQHDLPARAVIDASGTWETSNPIGAGGLPALGEEQARGAGFLVGPLPDVLGRDRERFAGRCTLVVGMGHSAANTLVALAQLAREVEGTRIVWAIRGASARRVFGGGAADELPDRGQLGTDLRDLVDHGALDFVTEFSARELIIEQAGPETDGASGASADAATVSVVGDTPGGERTLTGIHNIAAATGFRPDLGVLAELRLDLDPALESPRVLGPRITPERHSCGTVAPHGWRELAHADEPDFFMVGMKSYGRAPTFLITTGNEQVRSIVAHLAGDDTAADEVQLVLPETGVCSSSNALSDEQVASGDTGGGCCGPAPTAEQATARLDGETVKQGFATGVPNGRAGDGLALAGIAAAPSLLQVSDVSGGGGCCG